MMAFQKNAFFEKGENLLQNGILNFSFNRQESRWKVKIETDEKLTFLKKRDLAH